MPAKEVDARGARHRPWRLVFQDERATQPITHCLECFSLIGHHATE